jgi:hypothetical protein
MRGAGFACRCALAAALVWLGSRPGLAWTEHPWCMVYQDVGGAWACRYDSFAQCRAWARAGNQGFCAQNPGYPAAVKRPPKPRRAR